MTGAMHLKAEKVRESRSGLGCPFFSLLILSFIVLDVLSPASLFAKETHYKEYPIEIRPGDRIVISGLRGAVRLVASQDPRKALLKVKKYVHDKSSAADLAKFDALSFGVRREGAVVAIEMKGVDNKANLAQWLKPTAPEMTFDIEVPNLPVEVAWHEGQVTALNCSQPLTMSLVSGTVKTNATDGHMRIQIQHGQVALDHHRGHAEIDSFAAKVTVQDVDGDLGLTNFSGESLVQRVKGNIEMSANAGNSTLVKSSGSVEFTNGHGQFAANGFEGPIKGQTDQGSVSVALEGEADAEVRVEANQGAVTVKLPQASGAAIHLQSDEGALLPPESIKPAGSHVRVLNSRLTGAGPKGSVSLKSKSGNLRVKI